MVMKYESLKKVLSTINDKKDLNKDNIIQKIQEELKETDQGLYKDWEEGKFDVNHGFNILLYGKLTLLMIAAQNGHTNIVKILLEKGADINVEDYFGNTVLHLAARSGHEKTVEVLIQAVANVNAVDEYGKTPLDYAEEHTKKCAEGKYAEGYAESKNVVKAILEAGGRSFVKARNKAMIACGVTTLLGAVIAAPLFATGTIAAQLIPIFISVVVIAAVALIVGYATYAWSKPSTKVDGAEKSSAALINGQQGVTSIPS